MLRILMRLPIFSGKMTPEGKTLTFEIGHTGTQLVFTIKEEGAKHRYPEVVLDIAELLPQVWEMLKNFKPDAFAKAESRYMNGKTLQLDTAMLLLDVLPNEKTES